MLVEADICPACLDVFQDSKELLKHVFQTHHEAQTSLFHSLLNRGAANNTCYPPANCQQREIIILSPAH